MNKERTQFQKRMKLIDIMFPIAFFSSISTAGVIIAWFFLGVDMGDAEDNTMGRGMGLLVLWAIIIKPFFWVSFKIVDLIYPIDNA